MGKKVILTDRIRGLLSKATDGAVDPNEVSIFETIALNTLPISKRGTVFDKAVPDRGMLQAMADYVNGGGAVPLHTLHEQGYELPVGKVIYAETRDTFGGVTELRGLFYLPNTETELISKLETDVINEVSVGARSKQILCSECGFDFMGPDASFENLWTATCANGHEMGIGGVHARLMGLDRWMELSLVSLGAANNAKILARTKQLLGADQYNQLAASGVRPEVTTLFATTSQEKLMDFEKVLGDMSDLKAGLKVKDAELATATATITTLNAKVSELTAQLEAAKATPELAALQASLKEAQDSAKPVLAFVREEADRLCVAASIDKLPEDATFDQLKASIESSRVKLAQMFPTGGRANGINNDPTTNDSAEANFSAFKTR